MTFVRSLTRAALGLAAALAIAGTPARAGTPVAGGGGAERGGHPTRGDTAVNCRSAVAPGPPAARRAGGPLSETLAPAVDAHGCRTTIPPLPSPLRGRSLEAPRTHHDRPATEEETPVATDERRPADGHLGGQGRPVGRRPADAGGGPLRQARRRSQQRVAGDQGDVRQPDAGQRPD